MTKKEFYLVALIVVYTYIAIIFHVNVKNFIAKQSNPDDNRITFNAFE